jgi:hypothetical protein
MEYRLKLLETVIAWLRGLRDEYGPELRACRCGRLVRGDGECGVCAAIEIMRKAGHRPALRPGEGVE